jgi:hypothetical protein
MEPVALSSPGIVMCRDPAKAEDCGKAATGLQLVFFRPADAKICFKMAFFQN